MIYSVVVMDLIWMNTALLLAIFAPTLRTKRLLTALAIYCAIETLFHVPMESMAEVLFR